MNIVNIFPKITIKLNSDDYESDDEIYNENIRQILKYTEKSDKVIIAWGRSGEGNKNIRVEQEEILEQLKQYSDKLYIICDEQDRVGFRPLAPNIRFS